MCRVVGLAAAVLALTSAAGCTPPILLDRLALVELRPVSLSVRFQAADQPSAELVAQAVGPAMARLARWGDFAVPVEIDVVPTHAALEQVTARAGYGWLRAWARYREVIVQSPRTWSGAAADPVQVSELVTHELTHCLMYQLAASEEDWGHKEIPIWFREGMASVTAEQGYRRGSLELVGEAAARGLDPLGGADALYRDHSELVYAAAHHAFAALVARGGVGRVREVLAVIKGGLTFDPAFRQDYGLTRSEFEQSVLAEAHARVAHRAPP